VSANSRGAPGERAESDAVQIGVAAKSVARERPISVDRRRAVDIVSLFEGYETED
jgi:hypothetical protein